MSNNTKILTDLLGKTLTNCYMIVNDNAVVFETSEDKKFIFKYVRECCEDANILSDGELSDLIGKTICQAELTFEETSYEEVRSILKLATADTIIGITCIATGDCIDNGSMRAIFYEIFRKEINTAVLNSLLGEAICSFKLTDRGELSLETKSSIFDINEGNDFIFFVKEGNIMDLCGLEVRYLNLNAECHNGNVRYYLTIKGWSKDKTQIALTLGFNRFYGKFTKNIENLELSEFNLSLSQQEKNND